MGATGRRDFWRLRARRLIAGFTLAAYLVVALGVPLPALPSRDTSQPFPCQDNPCGCRNAEQCWRHCCCFTPEERWAWARAHQVEPPPYAERPDARGWHETRLRDREGGDSEAAVADCRCCRQPGDRCPPPSDPGQTCDGCPTPDDTATSCCQADPERRSDDRRPANPGLRWKRGLSALRCQGLAAGWVCLGAALPPPPPVTWTPFLDAAGWLTGCAVAPAGRSAKPPVPPPRD